VQNSLLCKIAQRKIVQNLYCAKSQLYCDCAKSQVYCCSTTLQII